MCHGTDCLERNGFRRTERNLHTDRNGLERNGTDLHKEQNGLEWNCTELHTDRHGTERSPAWWLVWPAGLAWAGWAGWAGWPGLGPSREPVRRSTAWSIPGKCNAFPLGTQRQGFHGTPALKERDGTDSCGMVPKWNGTDRTSMERYSCSVLGTEGHGTERNIPHLCFVLGA